MNAEKVLIVEDEQHLAELASIKLVNAGYLVLIATTGEEALAKVKTARPDLILLDTTLPGKDGFETCFELRRDAVTRDLPIIILLDKGQTPDQVRALGLRVEDCLAKPFSPRDVLARVNALMMRARYLKEANPLTGWTGRQYLLDRIAGYLAQEQPFALLVTDLDDFRLYNQVYGFARGDEVIKFVAETIGESAAGLPETDYHLGHCGGDDFMILVPAGKGADIAAEIVRRFEAGIAAFFTADDRARGGMAIVNRRGLPEQRPLLSISVALVASGEGCFSMPLEMDSVAHELIRHAKSMPGSNYVWDRRRA